MLILSSTTAYPVASKPGGGVDWTDPAWEREDGALARAMAEADIATTIWRLDRADEWRAVLRGVRFSSAWDRPYAEGQLKPARPPDPVGALTGHPVLVLHGEHDMAFPLAAARRLVGEVGSAELATIAEAGHMPQFDNSGDWLAAIREFLTRR
ncbi:alpha/beta hydrolase [Actinoplanes sp. NPDC051411]|uniref:alpha/beta fold hydrolase n=1 Tax=Actinoplanes sp. NPDC051411 TaxID=3155522 RepID=UPI00341CD54E